MTYRFVKREIFGRLTQVAGKVIWLAMLDSNGSNMKFGIGFALWLAFAYV